MDVPCTVDSLIFLEQVLFENLRTKKMCSPILLRKFGNYFDSLSFIDVIDVCALGLVAGCSIVQPVDD